MVEIKASGRRNTFVRVLQDESPKGEVRINGMFVYTMRRKPLKAGRPKTEEYIDKEIVLDASFCANGSQQAAWTTASATTAQLRSVRVLLSIIAHGEGILE